MHVFFKVIVVKPGALSEGSACDYGTTILICNYHYFSLSQYDTESKHPSSHQLMVKGREGYQVRQPGDLKEQL